MKFYGKIGFRETEESSPDVWTSNIQEYPYKGDVLKLGRTLTSENEINDSVKISNRISIVADPYARKHFFDILYVYWQGAKWKVITVDVEFPRLILALGGLYNESEQS